MEEQKLLEVSNKKNLAQFFTPNSIAAFMSSLLTFHKDMQVLDAGAGAGSLSCAVMERALEKELSVELDAFEIDENLIPELRTALKDYETRSFGRAKCNIINADFIEEVTFNIQIGNNKLYSHCILNPPYKKISSSSAHRKLLSKLGVETVNLYAAFVALALMQLKKGGEIVAIIPRSFCNGTYYLPFRKLLYSMCSIKQIHLFKSRSKPFSSDNVLQENIIIHLSYEKQKEHIKISHSTDGSFFDYQEAFYSKDEIIDAKNKGMFIHIPNGNENDFLPPCARYYLNELNLTVSTGPVIDFRNSDFLTRTVKKNVSPLIYPFNFKSGVYQWPREHKKSNGIIFTPDNINFSFPAGNYVLVKRFSSKEEKRRVVAYLLEESKLKSPLVGIENHLNVFHIDKKGLDLTLARGLAAYLNSAFIDKYFRLFSGHTQVNAGDLRIIKYPSIKNLIELGNFLNGNHRSGIEIEEFIQELK